MKRSSHQDQVLVDRFERALTTIDRAFQLAQHSDQHRRSVERIDASLDLVRRKFYALLASQGSPRECAGLEKALEEFSKWFARCPALIQVATDFRDAVVALRCAQHQRRSQIVCESLARDLLLRSDRLAVSYAERSDETGDETGRGGDRTRDLFLAVQNPAFPDSVKRKLNQCAEYVRDVRLDSADDLHNK